MKRIQGFFTGFLLLVSLILAACNTLRIPATGPESTLVPTINLPTATNTPIAKNTPTSTPVPPTATTTATATPAATRPAAPAIQLINPPVGVQLSPGQQVVIKASVTAAAGVARVELWADGKLINQAPNNNPNLTVAQVELPYSTQASGSHALSVLAYDTLDQVGTAGPFTVNVSVSSNLQTGFINPSGGPVKILAGQALALNYWGSSTIGVSRVELWVDGKLAFKDDANGAVVGIFQHNWSSNDVGDHSFFIRVIDTAQNLADSNTLTVTVAANTIPTVSIPAPNNGAVLPAGRTATISVSASDPGGLTHIELWIDGALYNSLDSPTPAGETTIGVNFAWPNPAAGSHQLYAIAFNKGGNNARTATLQVTVAAPTSTPTPSPTSTVTPTHAPTPTLMITVTP